MASLEQLLSSVQGLHDTPEHLETARTQLKQAEEMLAKSGADKLNVALSHLDPSRYSLAWLFLLDAQQGVTQPDKADAFINRCTAFLKACHQDQIRIAVEKFNSVCFKLKDCVLVLNQPARGVLPLRTAIKKLQPTSEHLTPQHADFLLLVVLSKIYNAGLPVLAEEIFEVDAKKTGIAPRDFLLYCYYGGMVYIGMKRFKKALELLGHAISAPAQVLNAITLEAYKKFVVVHLLVDGQLPTFQKYTPTIVQKLLKSNSQPYIDLGNAYATRSVGDLKKCIQTNENVYKTDTNLGLVKQLIPSLYKRNIQRLTQTYLTLSLKDIAEAVELEGPKEAELHVLRMIEEGEIFAEINQKDGMVSFREDPEEYNSVEMVNQLDAEMQGMIKLAKKVAAIDEQVSTDKAYLGKINLKERHSRFGEEDYEIGSQRMFVEPTY
ncbi:COP9 signalosome subunit CSN3 [Klebsormidium nitens]|uniref:COP9 signalosome complex subunit 3 n=1 Tax=Klebsormidium nitens TaxID=105231 RepID=A0A1Y1IEP4_KLENI|nr:COP9 signalosome subunit CSN3 [Klebsormidium nitens]|eukprot:GAQ87206.1 COP9 signalosome subunit CSN3 [Klebsormidium nitens]